MSNGTTRAFTGYHMAAILIGFFGIVIAVNIYMAKLAVGTFGGTIVDNSYVASQNYNAWLAEAERQKRLGWSVTASRAHGGRVHINITQKGVAGAGFAVSGVAQHPLGRAPDVRLSFSGQGSGEWVSNEALPSGRWQLHIAISRGRDHYLMQSEVR